MNALNITLIPGDYVILLLLQFFQLSPGNFDSVLLRVFAGFISWVFWMAIIRAVWAVTLKIFGFQPNRGRF